MTAHRQPATVPARRVARRSGGRSPAHNHAFYMGTWWLPVAGFNSNDSRAPGRSHPHSAPAKH